VRQVHLSESPDGESPLLRRLIRKAKFADIDATP
jgi:hypothetical protein